MVSPGTRTIGLLAAWHVYEGTAIDGYLHALLQGVRAALPQPPAAPEGVEITERWQGERRLCFLLNHTAEEVTVALPGPFMDLATGAPIAGGAITLGPREVRILSECA